MSSTEPRARPTTSSRRRGVVAAVLLVVLAGVSGCSNGATSDSVVDALEGTLDMRGYEVDDVTCPDGIDLEGDSVTCEVTISGKTYPVELASKGSGGSRGVDVDYDLSQLPEP